MACADDNRAWNAALGLAWLSPWGYHRLLRYLKTEGVEAVWRAHRRQLQSWGMTERAINGFDEKRASFSAAEARTLVDARGLRFVPYGDSDFPPELGQLTVPPAGLFVRATDVAWQQLLTTPRVTIVGTRRTTTYGARATESFAAAFAAAGIAVISGMAMGVDTRAHKAAVESGGLTAAVLGCGADIVYPTANRWLYQKIAEGGAVISELPPGATPAPWTFWSSRLLSRAVRFRRPTPRSSSGGPSSRCRVPSTPMGTAGATGCFVTARARPSNPPSRWRTFFYKQESREEAGRCREGVRQGRAV